MSDTALMARQETGTFFNIGLDEMGMPGVPIPRKVSPMDVGLFSSGLSDEGRKSIKEQIERELEMIGIEPLTFRSISFAEHAAKMILHRRGVLNVHDSVTVPCDRRPVASFVSDGNPTPPKAQKILHRLQKAGMPLVWSLTVWTPGIQERTAASPIPDPLLMLELPTGDCIGLCYWIA